MLIQDVAVTPLCQHTVFDKVPERVEQQLPVIGHLLLRPQCTNNFNGCIIIIQYNHYRDMLAFRLPICFHPAHRLALHHIMGAMPEIWRIWPGWFMLSFQGKFCCKMAWWCIQITWSTLGCGISDCYSKSKTSLMLNDLMTSSKILFAQMKQFLYISDQILWKIFFECKKWTFLRRFLFRTSIRF